MQKHDKLWKNIQNYKNIYTKKLGKSTDNVFECHGKFPEKYPMQYWECVKKVPGKYLESTDKVVGIYWETTGKVPRK